MPSTTRDRILDAALELIQQQGFGGTTVTDIEELAGLSPGSGSFYRHFRSKEEVFREVFERELARRSSAGRSSSAARSPTPRSPDALTVQQLEYLTQVRPLMNLLAREHGRFPDLTRRIRSLLVDQGIAEEAEHLARDLPSGAYHDDPHALLAVVVSALTGYELSRGFFGRPRRTSPPTASPRPSPPSSPTVPPRTDPAPSSDRAGWSSRTAFEAGCGHGVEGLIVGCDLCPGRWDQGFAGGGGNAAADRGGGGGVRAGERVRWW